MNLKWNQLCNYKYFEMHVLNIVYNNNLSPLLTLTCAPYVCAYILLVSDVASYRALVSSGWALIDYILFCIL